MTFTHDHRIVFDQVFREHCTFLDISNFSHNVFHTLLLFQPIAKILIQMFNCGQQSYLLITRDLLLSTAKTHTWLPFNLVSRRAPSGDICFNIHIALFPTHNISISMLTADCIIDAVITHDTDVSSLQYHIHTISTWCNLRLIQPSNK